MSHNKPKKTGRLTGPVISCRQWIELLDELNIGAFSVGKDRRIISMNYCALALIGLKETEVVGRDCREIFTGIPCMVNCVLRGQTDAELAEHVRIALESNIAGLAIIPNAQVVDLQNRDPDWETQNPARIGARFGADRTLMIALTQYTTREPRSPHLYRGRVGANVKVYNNEHPEAAPVYKTTVETVYPPDSVGSYGTDDRTIRRAMMQEFAATAAGRFYDRQVKVE